MDGYRDIICPHCDELVRIPEKKFGQPSPNCPACDKQIAEWLIEREDYNVEFFVEGGTGARRQGRRKWGGAKTL